MCRQINLIEWVEWGDFQERCPLLVKQTGLKYEKVLTF